jgi:uncharacterized protein
MRKRTCSRKSCWLQSKKRKPIASSKYYFFDVSILAELEGREFRPRTPKFGEAFEIYLMHELICYREYVCEEPLSYWRSTSGFEVDFIIGDHTEIEVKAKQNLSPVDLKSLNALAEEKGLSATCVSAWSLAAKIPRVLSDSINR